jgi:hypothetical protein
VMIDDREKIKVVIRLVLLYDRLLVRRVFFLLLYLRTRVCLLGVNKSEASELVYVMYLLGSEEVLH